MRCSYLYFYLFGVTTDPCNKWDVSRVMRTLLPFSLILSLGNTGSYCVVIGQTFYSLYLYTQPL